jgi:uncharacterized phage-like protein YoqJ
MTRICFTGHRAKGLCGYKKDSYTDFVNDLAAALLAAMKPNEQYTFISGGAQGFDQLAFMAVDIVKKTRPDTCNEVYVPFRGQADIWPIGSFFGQRMYNDMLNKADNVRYLHDRLTPRDNAVRLLMSRNCVMVDNSDITIALYEDDNWHDAKGGTAACMRYAETKNHPVIRLPYTITNGKLTADFANLKNLP